MMLLPSALSWESYAGSRTEKPQRPKLKSYGPYESQSSTSILPGSATLLASCRALQSMLGGPVQPVQPHSVEDTPIAAMEENDSTISVDQRLQSAPSTIALPRGATKRRRDEYEDEDTLNDTYQWQQIPEQRNAYKTPKRQRCGYEDQPVTSEDFDFNQPYVPHTFSQQQQPFQIVQESPTHTSSRLNTRARRRRTEQQVDWSSGQDRRFIETVLDKLNLTKRDWNESAKQMSMTKNKVSVGRRWNWLLGKGMGLGGLRREGGPVRRTELVVET